MKNENKKIILNIVALAAIAFSIVSLFAPVTTFNYKDIQEDMGYENSHSWWEADIYFMFQDYTLYDYSNIYGRSNVAHTYFFIYFFRYSTEDWAGEYLTAYDMEENQEQLPSSRILPDMIAFIFGGLFFILLYYFSYRIIKKCGKVKTKDFLFAGGMALGAVVGFLIAVYYIFNWMDVYNLGYNRYLKLDFGFYYMVISASLFIIAYFMQYFINFTKIEGEVNKENQILDS